MDRVNQCANILQASLDRTALMAVHLPLKFDLEHCPRPPKWLPIPDRPDHERCTYNQFNAMHHFPYEKNKSFSTLLCGCICGYNLRGIQLAGRLLQSQSNPMLTIGECNQWCDQG